LKHVLVAGGEPGKHLDYDAELTRAKPDSSIADTHRDDACVWLYTSGSTGFPKAAVHKQHDFIFNALTYGLPVLKYGPSDIGVSVPRLAFGYALGSNLLFPLLAGAATALFKEKPTPEKFFEMLERHRPTILTAVPTALNGILNSPGLKDADFSSLRVAISAGEALPAELYQRWKQRTGVEILDGIGSAEMFHIFITNRLGDVKLGSLGRVVDGYEAKICDDQGQQVPHGDVGTLWVRGDSMALEYWQLVRVGRQVSAQRRRLLLFLRARRRHAQGLRQVALSRRGGERAAAARRGAGSGGGRVQGRRWARQAARLRGLEYRSRGLGRAGRVDQGPRARAARAVQGAAAGSFPRRAPAQ
jgi:acyl-coenzyme A synthetase/AMP-(fatty) acid ligase